MAGTSAARVRRCAPSRLLAPDVRRAATWACRWSSARPRARGCRTRATIARRSARSRKRSSGEPGARGGAIAAARLSSGSPSGQAAAARAPAAVRLPPHERTRPGLPGRCALRRGHAPRAREPPSRTQAGRARPLRPQRGQRASRTAGLNTRLQDAGWRHFLAIRAYTPACAGTRVHALPPASTSQDGSGGGQRIHTSLRVRTPVCPHCALRLDRDEHAAKTIVWLGQRLRGLPAVAGGEPRTRRPLVLQL
jgi:Putative transposase DNA-binding domain